MNTSAPKGALGELLGGKKYPGDSEEHHWQGKCNHWGRNKTVMGYWGIY